MAGLADGRRAARCGSALGLAACVLVGAAACASPPVAAFHPAGPVPGTTAPQAMRAATARAAAGPAPVRGDGGFRFPAGFTITFQAAPAASAKRRAIVTGYEDYVRSFWSAIITHGRDHTYQRYLAGNALTFARNEISYYRSHGLTVRGTARYSNIRVTNVYFGHGAVIKACVDVTGLSRVTGATGTRVGEVYARRYLRYLEEVSEGQTPGGSWYVLHTGNYPATTSEGAICQ